MKIQKLIALGSGIFLIALFVFFSLYPQNPGMLPTVFEFTFHCLSGTSEYTDGYHYTSEDDAKDECYYNMRLSFLVIAYGISGFFLIRYVLKKTKIQKK